MPIPPSCLSQKTPSAPSCAWTVHDYKHFPTRGTTRADTKKGPAVYLPETTSTAIRALESETARAPDRSCERGAGKREYLRHMDRVIGWDRGREARASFVECSGGQSAGRAFHGRPMCEESVCGREWTSEEVGA
jgi:hypothetical protein